jgi:hypothetical protein
LAFAKYSLQRIGIGASRPRLLPLVAVRKGANVQRVTEFVFYELAVKIHPLTELRDDLKYSQVWLDWWNAREALDEIYRQRPLNFVTPISLRMYQAITAVVPQQWDDMVAKFPRKAEGQEALEEQPIPSWQLREIREAAKEFETVLRSECSAMDTYFVSKKGAYSTQDLVFNAHHQAPEPTRSRLPEITRLDFDQAGKCLAFDVPTAAAFHLLRGTEAVIRKYYELVVPGDKKADPRMRSWGTYIRLLKNHDGKPEILSVLTLLKDVYRNPVMHPEEIYTDERVQVLFGMCISAVVLIESEIKALTDKAGTLQFPATNAIVADSGGVS